MAKLAVVFVLALAALQSSSATPVNNLQRDAWNIFQYIQFLSYKIDQEMKKVTTHRPEEIKTFSDKINIIFSTNNIQNDIAKFKQDIRTLTKDVKPCGDDAERNMNLVVKSTLNGIASCENQIQLVDDAIEPRFESSSEKARSLADLLSIKILTCAKDHLSNYAEMKKCLEGFVFEIVHQLEDLQNEVRETLIFAIKSTDEGIENLKKCVVHVEEKIIVEESALVARYQNCVSTL